MNNLENLKKELEKSPLFYLSLGNKELFHSNFWAWLCLNYPEIMCEVFKTLLTNNGDERYKTLLSSTKIIINESIEREKNKIDLSFKFDNGIKLYIENKVKSLPDKRQLENYYQNNSKDNSIFLLLSLTKSNVNAHGWSNKTYSDFIKILQTNFQKHKNSNSLDKKIFIIEDYIDFVNNLTSLIKFTFGDNLDSNKTFGEYIDNIEFFKSIRIDDLLYKLLFEFIRKMLLDKFETESKYQVFTERPSKEEKFTFNNQLYILTDMTRGTPLIDIGIRGNIYPLFRVQLQNKTLKLMVTLSDNKNWEAKIEPIEKVEVFDFDIYKEYLSQNNEREKNYGKYYSYNNKNNFDLYLMRNIKKETNIFTVIDLLYKYSEKLSNKYLSFHNFPAIHK